MKQEQNGGNTELIGEEWVVWCVVAVHLVCLVQHEHPQPCQNRGKTSQVFDVVLQAAGSGNEDIRALHQPLLF